MLVREYIENFERDGIKKTLRVGTSILLEDLENLMKYVWTAGGEEIQPNVGEAILNYYDIPDKYFHIIENFYTIYPQIKKDYEKDYRWVDIENIQDEKAVIFTWEWEG